VRFWPSPTPLCSTRPLFAELDLLPVFSIYLLKYCKVVIKFPHYFKKTKDVHVYDTRGKSKLYVCVKNLAISRQNPLHAALNCIICSLFQSGLSIYETALKTCVRQRKFYTIEEYSNYMKNL